MSLLTSAATKRGAFIHRQVCRQSFGGSGVIRFGFGLNPFGVGIARRRLVGEPEPAFGRTFEIGFEEQRGDSHGGR
jgi:hypothetical protein